MKIQFRISAYLAVLATTALIYSCSNDQKAPAEQKPVTPAPTIGANPFKFYKDIEIKPGYHFEVLSWGKGVDTVGAYLILMSDSLKNNFKSMSAERNGIVTEAWNMDLDNDGNPEIYIQYLQHHNASDLQVYEFAGSGFDKISFPGLKESFKKDYKGDDKFFVKNGDLFRAVPLVQTDSGKTTTLIKTLQYRLRGNSFSSEEVKPQQ